MCLWLMQMTHGSYLTLKDVRLLRSELQRHKNYLLHIFPPTILDE